jgi:type VII secretion protein EccE
VVQLIGLELAVGAVAAAWYAEASVTILAATGAAALVVLVVVFGRARGGWMYQTMGTRWRLRRRKVVARRIRTRLAKVERPGSLAALAPWAPGLAIRSVDDRGRTIGVGQDEAGWFAAVSLAPWPDLSGNRGVRFSLDQLAGVLDETTVPVSALQLVSHLTPAPTGRLEQTSAAVRSYRDLAFSARCPLEQTVWLAVRLSPADAAEAASNRGGGVAGVDRAIAATIGRIEKALAGAGVPYQVLDADGLRDALTVSCGLEEVARSSLTGTAVVSREQWSSWSAGGLAHACFTVRRWPREPSPDLLSDLAQVPASIPASAVSVAIAIRPHAGQVALVGLVRVVAPLPRLRAAVRQLDTNAGKLGVRLRRLDGEQARAVYATAPTGGGALT